MSKRYCPFCYEDWSMYAEAGEKVAGFTLRGLNFCCTEQVHWWVANKSRLSPENQQKVLQEIG